MWVMATPATPALKIRSVAAQQRLAKPPPEHHAIPRRQYERIGCGADFDLVEDRAAAAVDAGAHGRDFRALFDDARLGKSARSRDGREVHAVSSVRFLHSGFAV